ncbi:MAG: alpha/beta hydrolase [Actinomycetota bacterium]|nr:alpha/beta hydrolase [Actinomycetota bacterium]
MRTPVPPRSLRISTLAVATCVALGTAACSRAQEIRRRALADSSPVTFATTDGTTLAGRLFGPADATTGVVFAHMVPADQSSWFDLADYVGERGYRALTFDFRGYCPGGDAGCSGGTKDPSSAPTDLTAAVEYLRAKGVRTIALVGASMGGTAALAVASEASDGIAAVITLSAPAAIDGLQAGPDAVERVTAAKLFIAGSGDAPAAAAAEAFYDQSLQPKDVQILTSDDDGTDLLEGNQSVATRDLITSWLGRFVPV